MVSERIHLERAGTFVELQQHGTRIDHAHGRLGERPHTRQESCESELEASAMVARQVRRLERKGFRAGVHDDAFEAAILADPHSPGPRLVYADWLIDRHDPRGELITRMAAGVAFADLLVAHPYHLAPPWLVPMGAEWRLGFVRAVTFEGGVFDTSLLVRLFRHPSMMVLEEIRVHHGVRHVHASMFRETMKRRPASLQRIDALHVAAFGPLLGEIPGLVV